MTHHFVLADADKCIGCRTCEVACALSHIGDANTSLNKDNFASRLQLVKTFQVSVPVICRQCENAPCASVCPNDAIVRGKHGLDVIQSRCIGCKSCVVACPFGAISVAVSSSGQNDSPQSINSEAYKCDLCSHSTTGPACIAVCPTDALRLVTDTDLAHQTSIKRLRTAREDAAIRHF